MYPIVLGIHNIFRWIVLILGILAAVRAWMGWTGNRPWTERDRKIGSFFGISMDIQLLLGLLLYFFLSPITRTALQNFGAAMGSADMRFFALEHVFYMVVAVVFAHLGSILARRAATDKAKFRQAAIWFSLALVVVLAGIPWSRPLLPGIGAALIVLSSRA